LAGEPLYDIFVIRNTNYDEYVIEKFCTINNCDENPIPKNAEYIPPFVKGGDGEKSISPMRYLEYSVGIGFESDKMRKDILQNIFCVEFWTPKMLEISHM
jgi:hypothetical protein